MSEKKLVRKTSDKMIAGVCSGLAEYFGIDTIIVRIIFLVLLFTGSVGFWGYIILWIVVPEESGGSVIDSVRTTTDEGSGGEPPAE